MFFKGVHDQSNDMVNPIKILQAANEFGQHEADIYIPDPDGHVEDGDAFARKLGRDTLHSFDVFHQDSAYGTGQSAANVASVLLPGAAEAGRLNGLRVVARGAGLEEATARAAAKAATGTPGEAGARAAAEAAGMRKAAAQAALREALPGARAGRAVRQAVAKGRQATAAGRAALARGRAALAERAAARRLAERLASPAKMRGRWRA